MIKKRLHQLFNDAVLMPIARLPLIGPHGNSEISLLLSGAKPAGWVSLASREEMSQLDDAVKEGRLIRCAYPQSFSTRFHFCTVPGYENEALALQNTLSIDPDDRNMSGEEQDKLFRRIHETGFFGDSIRDTSGMPSMKRKVVHALQAAAGKLQNFSFAILPSIRLHALTDRLIIEHAVDELAQGKRMMGAFAEHGLITQELIAKLKQAEAEGKITISSHDIVSNRQMLFYGQPGQEKTIERLAALHNLKPGDPEPEGPGIGELFGYSDRDETLWEHGWPKNKIVSGLLYATQDLRRELRIKLMLDAGPGWKRNMD